MTEASGTRIAYVLAPRAIERRARAIGAWRAAATAAPALLVVVLVAQLGTAPGAWLAGFGAAMVALTVARALAESRAAMRRLAQLTIEADDAGLLVRTAGGEARVEPRAIAGAIEHEGALGGLSLALRGEDLPSRMDVPRGGDGFAELRARIASWAPIERPPRRGKIARLALGVAIVAGVFFAPFVLDDARGSRVAVAALVLAAWGGMRLLVSRA